jgi:hypothetical protein
VCVVTGWGFALAPPPPKKKTDEDYRR